MKFFLKLTLLIIIIFTLLLLSFYIWTPIKIKYYAFQLRKNNYHTREKTVNEILNLGEEGIETIKQFCIRFYLNNDNNSECLEVVDILSNAGVTGREIIQSVFFDRCRREQIYLKAGSFLMGSEKKILEMPVHEVHLSSFYMDKYEVTNEKYYVFIKCTGRKAPEHWKSGRFPPGEALIPVTNVSWYDANEYAKWLGMNLPTEAQWEYACKAGSTTDFCFGDNVALLSDYAWFDPDYSSDRNKPPHPIGTKKPNKWGLYDMHGNVNERVYDWFSDKYYADSPEENPTGPKNGKNKTYRGGSKNTPAVFCRSARRGSSKPNSIDYASGFRVCYRTSK